MKYKDWLCNWLSAYVRPVTKQRTFEKYERICRVQLVPYLGEYPLEQLSPMLLQNFVNDLALRYAPNTVNATISVCTNSLKRAVACGVLAQNVAEGIVRPRSEEKPVECFTADEQKLLERYVLGCKNHKLAGIVLCLYTGLRIGELMALCWEDVDLAKGLIYVTKSCHDGWTTNGYQKIVESPKTKNSVRVIPIPKQLVGFLKGAKRGAGGKYVVGGDKAVSVRSYQRTFGLVLNKLHIAHRGFHALRHTFATRAIECGMDVKTLSEILGHKNANVTLNRYVHSLLDHKRNMMDRLGKLLK